MVGCRDDMINPCQVASALLGHPNPKVQQPVRVWVLKGKLRYGAKAKVPKCKRVSSTAPLRALQRSRV